MSDIFITTITGVLAALGSGFASFIFTRSKYKSEVRGNDIQNMSESLRFYQNLVEDTNLRLEQVIAQNNILEAQLDALRELNLTLKTEITYLKEQIESLNNLIAKRRGQKPKNA